MTNASFPQVGRGTAIAVSLVRADAVRCGAGPTGSQARHPDPFHDRLEPGAVRPLPGSDEHRQRAAATVRAQVEFGGETPRERPSVSPPAPPPPGGRSVPPGSERSRPPCQSPLWDAVAAPAGRRPRAGGLARRSIPRTHPSRCRQPRQPRPGPAGGATPRCRPLTSGDAARAPSSTGRGVPADRAHCTSVRIRYSTPLITCRWSRHRPQRRLLTGRSGSSRPHWASVRSSLCPTVLSTTQLIGMTLPNS